MQRGARNRKFYEYRNGILLSLFLEPPSLQVADVIRRLNYIYGDSNVRKPTVLEHLQRLFDVCIIDRKRFIIHPKHKRRGGKVFYKKRVLNCYPVAASIIAKTDKKKQAVSNFGEDKYEVFCRIDPNLSPGYIACLRHEVARFYGFKHWYGGIIKENNSPLKTYDRIRNTFYSLKRARQRNWPARSINDYLKNMPGMPQQADEEGKLEADGSRLNQSCNKLGIGTYQKSSPAHFLKR